MKWHKPSYHYWQLVDDIGKIRGEVMGGYYAYRASIGELLCLGRYVSLEHAQAAVERALEEK